MTDCVGSFGKSPIRERVGRVSGMAVRSVMCHQRQAGEEPTAPVAAGLDAVALEQRLRQCLAAQRRLAVALAPRVVGGAQLRRANLAALAAAVGEERRENVLLGAVSP